MKTTWKKVLNEIYKISEKSGWYSKGNPEFQSSCDTHKLAKTLNISNGELTNHISVLREYKFLKSKVFNPDNLHNDLWEMTQKGIDVAMHNETIKRSDMLNLILTIATIIMTISTLIPILPELIEYLII